MIKIYCRFRFLNINFGPYLSAYFNFSAEKFDPPTSKSLDEIGSKSNKFYGNLLWKKVALDLFEHNKLKAKIYGVCWIFKLIGFALLGWARSTQKISKVTAHFVQIFQKIHMIALNSIAMDLIPYCLITLFHTKEIGWIYLGASYILFSLLVIDF